MAYAGTNGSGAGWNADLREPLNPSSIVTRQYGYGRIYIESVTPGPVSGSTNLVANYYHVKSTGSIGLAIGPLSVSFSGGASYDSVGTTKNFDY